MSHCAPSSSTGLTVFLVLPNRQPPQLSSNATSNVWAKYFFLESLGRVSGSRFSFLGTPPAIPVLVRHDRLAPGLIANHRRNHAIRTQHWKGETNHAADDSDERLEISTSCCCCVRKCVFPVKWPSKSSRKVGNVSSFPRPFATSKISLPRGKWPALLERAGIESASARFVPFSF